MGYTFFSPRASCGAAHAAISPVDQAMADVRQRLVWVWRELRAEHPEMDEAALEAIAGRDPASILVEEVMRLRAENARLREHARWDQLRRTPRAPRS